MFKISNSSNLFCFLIVCEFELIQNVLIYTLISAIVMGMVGVLISSKISKRILMYLSD